MEGKGSKNENNKAWMNVLPAACAVFCISFYIYYSTLFPSVPPGDSGELIAAAHAVGVAHPPGYPLFTILAKLFSVILPFRSIAWRVNLMNAVFGGSSSSFLFITVFRLTSNSWCALFASCMYAFSPLVWLYSVTAEVFAMNNFLCTLLLFLVVEFQRTNDLKMRIKLMYVGAFVCGLSMCNQHTSTLFVLPLTIWILLSIGWGNILAEKRIIVVSGILLLVGLSPYAYIPWASWRKPLITWGDGRSFSGFLKHILRQEYGTLKLSPMENGDSQLLSGFVLYIRSLRDQTCGVGGVILTAIGLLISITRGIRSSEFIFCLTYLFYLTFFHWRANLPLEKSLFRGVSARFWMQPNILAFIMQSCAIHMINSIALKRFKKRYVRYVMMVGVIGLISWQVGANFSQMDESKNYFTRNFGEAQLKFLPKNSILLTKGDIMVNSARYAQSCESVREDIHIIDQEMMTYPWYLSIHRHQFKKVAFPGEFYHVRGDGHFNMAEFIDSNYEKFPIFVSGGWKSGDVSMNRRYYVVPFGLPGKIVRIGDKFRFEEWRRNSRRALPDFEVPDLTKYGEESWEHVIYNDYFEASHRRAVYILEYYMSNSEKMKTKKREEALLDAAESFDKFLNNTQLKDVSFVHKNLGIACQYLWQLYPKETKWIGRAIYEFGIFVKTARDVPKSDIDNVKSAVETLKKYTS